MLFRLPHAEAAPRPHAGPWLKSPVPRLSVAQGPEESDGYPRIVVRLNPQWRVIACRDGLQWILQKRRGLKHGRPRWANRYFFRTRAGLVCGCREYAGELAGDALVVLLRLPPFFPEGAS